MKSFNLTTRRKRLFRWLWLVLAIAAFALSLLPEGAKETLHTKGVLHAWLHLGLFAVLGALAIFSSNRTHMRLLLVACAMLLGLSIEYSEAVRFHSAFEPYDVMTDTCGVLIGALAGWLLTRKRS